MSGRGGPRRLRSVVLAVALALTGAAPRPVAARQDADGVRAAVERLFEGMRSADAPRVRSVLATDARFAVLHEGDGSLSVGVETTDAWVEAVGRSAGRWDERLHDMEIRVDGDVASVWANYAFYLDGAVHHCGIDSIELLRDATGWKITQISDTERAEPCPAASAAPRHVLRFAALLDGNGQVTPDAVVVVEGDRIVAVGSGPDAIPEGATVTDLRPLTAIPGMIDAHTHITYYWDQAPGTQPWSENGSRRMAETVFLAQENARRTLQTGVTTVRDLGSREYGDLSMRDLIARGAMVGPRIFGAGYGLSKLRSAPDPGAPPAWPRGRIRDISEIDGAVKAQVDAGADVIKMYGSTGSGNDVTGDETFTFEEMKAAVDAAHRYGKRIAIHSYGPQGGRDAIRAGTESLEHAVDLTPEDLAEMVRRGTVYVPTIDHNRYYAAHLAEFGYTAEDGRNLDAYRARNLETARRAFEAGVTMAMGSDAVFTGFGENTRELAWFVEIGMTPAEALATATVNGAALLGMEDSLGRVAPGFYADIVAVDGNPSTDVRAVIDGVKWVMKAGEVVVDVRDR